MLGPSIRAIFGWANERFSDHWPGLFAIGSLMAVIPATRSVLEQGNRNAFGLWVGSGIALAAELVILLGTAAMVLLVVGPPSGRAGAAIREAAGDAPRLIAVKIVTTLVRFIPAFALAAAVGARGILSLVAAFVLLPVGFVCQMAFAGAVIERTGPFGAVGDAFHRASEAGLGKVFGVAILFALVEQLPPLAFAWAANAFFPPAPIPYTPHLPSSAFPYPLPPMALPGKFGSGIPWWTVIVVRVIMIPITAYVATLYAAAALAFAGGDVTTRENPEDAIFEAYSRS